MSQADSTNSTGSTNAMTLTAPFDFSEIRADLPKPKYTRDNRDEFNNHYQATIRIGGRVLTWMSYDSEHLQMRIDRAGLAPFVTCFTIESADWYERNRKRNA